MYKSSKIILILVVVLVVVLGFGGYYIVKMNDKISEQGNIINSIATNNGASGRAEENGESNSDKRKNKNTSNSVNNSVGQKNEISSNNVNNTVEQKNETGKNTSDSDGGYVLVNREGMGDRIYMKKYVSSMGYSMMYDAETFSFSDFYREYDREEFCDSGHDNAVIVYKENISYNDKVSKLSNAKSTTVNGMNAVYTIATAEGLYEETYYVSGGEEVTFMITISCPNEPEYIEGIGAVMTAMVQTFSVM